MNKTWLPFARRQRIPLIELSQSLHAKVDAQIVKVQAGHLAPACKKGCHHCCSGLIPATIPELLDLAQEVDKWDDLRKVALKDRLETYGLRSKVYWSYDLHVFSEVCPFLDQGECSVYAHRPLFCRGKSSYVPEDCERQARGEPVPLRVVPGQHESASYTVGAIVQGLKQTGRYSGTFDLAAAMKMIIGSRQITEELARGLENPLSGVMMGSDTNVKFKPLNSAAKQFMQPELYQCFGPGVSPEQQFERASKLAKRNPYSILGQLVLPSFYASQDEVETWWNRYEESVSRLEEVELDPKVAFEGVDLGGACTFGLAYCGKNVRPVIDRLVGIVHRYASLGHPELTAQIVKPRRPGKFRLGYVSRRLTFNNGSRWALGWATEHTADFETYAFNLNEADDNVSTRWRRNVDHYFHLPIPLVDAAQKIRDLDLDALIFTDVGTDGTSIQLSTLRTARYQLAAWGFPMTTGSTEIDYFLSSEDMEPVNGQDHYIEKLVLLPGSGQTFPKARRSQPSSKSATELALPKDGFALIAQNPIKLLPKRDRVFAEIAERLGKPIVICASSSGRVGDLVAARMKRANVPVINLPFMTDSDFFRVIQLADVVLDSFDFGGGITTVDALTLRKPPVSCPGEFMRSRLCIPFMKQAGVMDMITTCEEDFVSLACAPSKIAAAAERCDPEPIYRDLRPVRALEAFLLSLSI